jgi:predicted DNA-binding transcriptional regulator AlpA
VVTTPIADLLDVLVERISDAVAEKVIAGVIAAMPPPATPWKLLDVHEVAALLGRSRRTVSDYVKYRGLPTVRLDDGSLRFDPRDVQDWCRSRRIPAADPSETDCRTIARPLSIPSRRGNRIPNPATTGGGGR